MARIRSIKPEFWSNEQVMECSTNARLLFVGLWNFVDDHGRHPLSPIQIKALVFPGDNFSASDIREMLDELERNGLLRYYTVENKQYFLVTGWHHQKIDRRQKPKFPAPNDECSSNDRRGVATEYRTQSTEGNTEKEGSEANASGGDAPKVVLPLDARTALFRDGLLIVRELTGKPEGPSRTLVGKWLKATNDDAAALLNTLRRAAALRPADPMSWIEAAVKPRSFEQDDVWAGVQV
ncbi:hypothetical protein GCM10007276_12130 [Agaricicola taiwanensis]|uniref:Helix-turn-helix domain-containing protein n=1 Tax=Agaricicola taiwanensis TaxID=591372 RepID=A0A8J2VLG7_9RHOB|nr:hypothetical protein [Agaricicola taiwanensis]GGE36230.1 hypothetical protein GCM10007276_12130 [Agaricicola taiwanensis]